MNMRQDSDFGPDWHQIGWREAEIRRKSKKSGRNWKNLRLVRQEKERGDVDADCWAGKGREAGGWRLEGGSFILEPKLGVGSREAGGVTCIGT